MNIVTVTPNAAIDTSIFLPRFELGGFNRGVRVERRPGGKGNNVVRILRTLGHDVVATGFIGGQSGMWIEQELQRAGIGTDFVRVTGQSRTCYAMIEDTSPRVTEVVEPGVLVDATSRQRLLDVVRKYSTWADAFVLSGSLPSGLPLDYYSAIVQEAKKYGTTRVALDTSGEALRAGLRGQPWVIKPNLQELNSLIENFSDQKLVLSIEKTLLPQMNPNGYVLVSLGPDGLLAVDRAGVQRIGAPKVRVVNTVGCGDALLAGFIHMALQGRPLLESLRYAVACGSAAALQDVAGIISLDDVENLLNTIERGEDG